MTTAVCSLFEHSYHIGFAVLTNSLYRAGFRGVVYAGYRGALPHWARAATASAAPDGTLRLTVAPDLHLRFMEVSTDRHLTNFKARFMQRVWAHAPEVDALFYFDPDIVVRGRWPFFERWVAGGVALCEDVNDKMPPSHPLRNEWRQLFAPLGITCRRELDAYFNAGFIGIRRQDASFIDLWERRDLLPSVILGVVSRDSTSGIGLQPIEKAGSGRTQRCDNGQRCATVRGRTRRDGFRAWWFHHVARRGHAQAVAEAVYGGCTSRT